MRQTLLCGAAGQAIHMAVLDAAPLPFTGRYFGLNCPYLRLEASLDEPQFFLEWFLDPECASYEWMGECHSLAVCVAVLGVGPE